MTATVAATLVEDRVRYIFNEMGQDYDDLRDLWYAWLMSRLHFLITKYVIANWNHSPRRVLDIGCGTGFQSFLYALTGAEVTGIDISDELVKLAKHKALGLRKGFPCSLFPAHFAFVDRYDRRIGNILKLTFWETIVVPPSFRTADARSLPFDDQTFDHINCCGSTLNFIPDHERALAEIARVLKPGATFILEVEPKFSLDLLWTGNVFRAFRESGHMAIEYPFDASGKAVSMPLKLFSNVALMQELEDLGLKISRKFSIHSVTNPSPALWRILRTRILR